MKGIADTGFIVGFGNRNDRYHGWAVEIASRMTDPLLTCEAVLAEAAFHLRSSSYVLSQVHDDMLGGRGAGLSVDALGQASLHAL